MYQEFNQHKKADTVKWIVAFVLIFALMGGVIASILLATNQNKVGNTGSVIELDDGSLLVNESDSANDETYKTYGYRNAYRSGKQSGRLVCRMG